MLRTSKTTLIYTTHLGGAMDEVLLTASVCKSRTAHETLIRIGMDSQDFGEAARCIIASATEQYKRDAELQSVDVDVLRSQVLRRFGAGSMATSVMDFVHSFPADVSEVNVAEEYRLLCRARVATSLATMLATGQHGDETQELLAKYARLSAGETTSATIARLSVEDFEDDKSARIPIAPDRLNAFIGGGVLRGHCIVVYGRPESGKSMFGINQAAHALRNGYRVLYVANEEPAQEITKRLLSRLAAINIVKLRDRDTLREAFRRVEEPYANWFLMHKTGVTAGDIGRYCEAVKPDFVIVDQLKNLSCPNDNRALQLDTVARQVRELGTTHNCVTIAITQAGASAEGKLVLGLNDVEWSNTGIPGAADLMVGIGVDAEFDASGKRMLSVPKNKVNGAHGAFHVWVDPQQTALLSKARAR